MEEERIFDLAKVILFPKAHIDYTYNDNECMNCSMPFKVADLIDVTECIDLKEKIVRYLCSSCAATFKISNSCTKIP